MLCGVQSISVTKHDFYPVFLVIRSCGTVPAMLLGWLIAGQHYTVRQIVSVLLITTGAALTTHGCYQATQDTATEATSGAMFLVGFCLLLGNVMVDAGLGVTQQRVFHRHGRHVDECVAMMSALGTLFMTVMAGGQAVHYITLWVHSPTWAVLPLLGVAVPVELSLLTLNFFGNW